jgi:hypothetical protein
MGYWWCWWCGVVRNEFWFSNLISSLTSLWSAVPSLPPTTQVFVDSLRPFPLSLWNFKANLNRIHLLCWILAAICPPLHLENFAIHTESFLFSLSRFILSSYYATSRICPGSGRGKVAFWVSGGYTSIQRRQGARENAKLGMLPSGVQKHNFSYPRRYPYLSSFKTNRLQSCTSCLVMQRWQLTRWRALAGSGVTTFIVDNYILGKWYRYTPINHGGESMVFELPVSFPPSFLLTASPNHSGESLGPPLLTGIPLGFALGPPNYLTDLL